MALALFQFFSTYGVFEELISDPGSDLTSEVVKHLTDWYGIRHVFSLVDRHESNGVEGTNKSILRHLQLSLTRGLKTAGLTHLSSTLFNMS